MKDAVSQEPDAGGSASVDILNGRLLLGSLTTSFGSCDGIFRASESLHSHCLSERSSVLIPNLPPVM